MAKVISCRCSDPTRVVLTPLATTYEPSSRVWQLGAVRCADPGETADCTRQVRESVCPEREKARKHWLP